MHVPEQHVPGARLLDRRQQRLAPPLHPAGNRVVEELRHRRRNVRAQHVHFADGLDLGREHLVVDLVRRPVGRLQPAPDEAEGPPVQLDSLAVQDVLARPHVVVPEPGQVHVPVGQVRRHGHGREQLGVLPGDRCLDVLPRVAAQPGPQLARHLARLIKAPGRAELHQAPGFLRPEQVGEDSLTVIGVVDEEEQISQADKGVGALPGRAQGVRPAVNVTYHVHPHPPTVGKSGKKASPARGGVRAPPRG